MHVSEPIIVGCGRYRIHKVDSGSRIGYEVEWQRDFKRLQTMHLDMRDGTVLEFLTPPPWESCEQLFDDEASATHFAIKTLRSHA